jgi:pimeloyl-ACP methyl ester carboxylesterase
VTPADPAHTLIPSTDGVRVALYDLGGPEDPAAPGILFSHATGFHGRVWEPMAERLSDRYRCFALDYRGHGLSELPPGVSLVWSGLGRDAVAVLDSDLIDPARAWHGVGHSMGGAALAQAASQRPGAFGSLWLYEPIIVEPGRLPQPDGPNPMAEGAARRRASFPSFDAALENFASKPPLNELHPDALRCYVMGGFAQLSDGSVTLRCRPLTEAAVFQGAFDNGAWAASASLEFPIAVVAGRDESFGPVAFAGPLVHHLPRATLVERRHLGHFGPLENPTTMAADVAAWIESTSS